MLIHSDYTKRRDDHINKLIVDVANQALPDGDPLRIDQIGHYTNFRLFRKEAQQAIDSLVLEVIGQDEEDAMRDPYSAGRHLQRTEQRFTVKGES